MINYTDCDILAIKTLDDFLPEKIFDAHMHISLYPFAQSDKFGIDDYKRDTAPIFSGRYVRCAALAAPAKELKNQKCHEKTIKFFENQLDLFPDCVGSVMVKPEESYDDISSHVKHHRIKGLKCYHKYAKRENTDQSDIHEYLSHDTLSFANDRKMAITLHLVKDHALADQTNMKEIKAIAQNYPNIKLILAHSARAFAPWTVIESVSELVSLENVFFDFSAICESPSIIAILKKIGVSRCLWGSDYNVSASIGKAISIGDGFYWINEEDISRFPEFDKIHSRHIIVENLMAVREASILSELSSNDVEDIFYNNACHVFDVVG